jgi:hypothetical protein
MKLSASFVLAGILFAASSALAANQVTTYPENPGLTTGLVERFRKVFVDPSALSSTLAPAAPLAAAAAAPAAGESWDLRILNDRTGKANIAINKVAIGELGPIETGVIHGLKPGAYDVSFEYLNGYSMTRRIVTTPAAPAKPAAHEGTAK